MPGQRAMHCVSFLGFAEACSVFAIGCRLITQTKGRSSWDGRVACSRPPHPYICLTLDGDMQQSPNLEQRIRSADPAGLWRATRGQDGECFHERNLPADGKRASGTTSPLTNPALHAFRSGLWSRSFRRLSGFAPVWVGRSVTIDAEATVNTLVS
ncbi:hypothetical protein B0I37DRAFT_55603 [Chaetomium sp. MPI-CAGE-AT-0009]|nr:hypothetical protein B0I37DRAFT_55603 [Chaetomium sp. MPI-CAGE-AT-0009]